MVLGRLVRCAVCSARWVVVCAVVMGIVDW